MSGDSGSNDRGRPSANGEVSHDALGDTHLGRSLKELIKEIGEQRDAAQRGMKPGAAREAESRDADSYDLTASRFDMHLEEAVSEQRDSQVDQPQPARTGAELPGAGEAAPDAEAEVSETLAGMETLLQQFIDAERRRCEQQLAEWKEQLKKATMIVIKKQVDSARERWMQSQGANEAKLAEQYRKLKALADKVAKQKAQIQRAKQELEQKLEVADKLHSEFDEIRNVLDGQIDAIDALDKNGSPD